MRRPDQTSPTGDLPRPLDLPGPDQRGDSKPPGDLRSPDARAPDSKATDTAPSGEVCDNGKDDDGDGQVDCVDQGSCTGLPCVNTSRTFVIYEVFCGNDDYVVLRNVSSVTRSLAGYTLEMRGTDTVTFSLPAQSVGAGQVVGVFELQAGTKPGDINTGGNIPFHNGIDANAVLLRAPDSSLLDYVGMGDALVGRPAGVVQSGGAVSWTGFNPDTQSHYHAGMKGQNPIFLRSDWVAAPKSR